MPWIPRSGLSSSTYPFITATVPGHRMYLLGWGNTRGENTYLVQYVDTLTGCDSTYGSRVPSNGGIICVVLATEKVLQMWEDFHLCEQAEKILNLQKSVETTKIVYYMTFLFNNSAHVKIHNKVIVIICLTFRTILCLPKMFLTTHFYQEWYFLTVRGICLKSTVALHYFEFSEGSSWMLND